MNHGIIRPGTGCGMLALATLLACGGGSGGSSSPAGGNPPPPAQHLYVADDNAGGQIRVYTLPLSASSTPAFTISFPWSMAVALNPNGDLAAADRDGNVKVFAAPLSGSSTPSAGFRNGSGGIEQLAFGPSGKLFACTQGTTVNVFTAPFTNATVFGSQVTDPTVPSSMGVAFDAQGNLYLAGAGTHVDVLAAEGSGAASASLGVPAGAGLRQIAVGGGQLFLANVAGTTGSVFVYTLPLTSSSVPVATLSSGMNSPEAVAVDASGNLYVGNLGDGTIKVFAPPFTSSSTPVVSLPTTAGIFGIAVGK